MEVKKNEVLQRLNQCLSFGGSGGGSAFRPTEFALGGSAGDVPVRWNAINRTIPWSKYWQILPESAEPIVCGVFGAADSERVGAGDAAKFKTLGDVCTWENVADLREAMGGAWLEKLNSLLLNERCLLGTGGDSVGISGICLLSDGRRGGRRGGVCWCTSTLHARL